MEYRRREVLGASAAGIAAAVGGCLGDSGDDGEGSIAGEELAMATTTSTEATGLLDELNAAFRERFGTRVAANANGTGAAIRSARDGNADVILVHARSQEDEFMRDGYGVNRRDLMFNDFVVVGPSDDPAGVGDTGQATAAFEAIADAEATFVSRGDESGTHTKELAIWSEAGLEPGGEWYQQLGQGMGETLTNANESGAYTLSDRGTYLSRDDLDLEILLQGPIEGGPELLANPYGIMAVNPEIHDDVNYQLAMAYIGFVTSPEGQAVIEDFTANGEQLFFPEALSEDPNFRQYVPAGWQPDGSEE
ncbi:molybdate transport protein [Natrinema pellirubrum DSM 15624]|uniref:ABC-type tungstate transport system, permease component n=1 Tax=Natrinema pellirubrum (strain DSM 15624 / CIP 106293 / JCM 10476 / NCIMB 786 / 157) TaxID=797303 RepID=L0JMK2_NATP1|nr:substrate-binding domain-containing protein [Natrinema pellirubrum]AGB32494.1 ABC-type tungstate transport system, permease component [Natrinema pellirubrum DSM 15624]ELY73633.1 molybdate transport protein [Natrinema pellirubrum DSM 15624]